MCSVPVFGVEGETLAPCHPARARQLLKNNRAVVESVQPFSIRLLSRRGIGLSCHPGLSAYAFPLSSTDLPAHASGGPHSITPPASDCPANPVHGKADNSQTQEVRQ